MTATTTFTFPGMDTSLQTVTIVKGDGKGFRTALPSELATSYNYKGKLTPESSRPYASYVCFTFANGPTDPTRNAIRIEFSQVITSISPSGAVGTSTKKIDYASISVAPNTPFRVRVYGNKGSALKVSKWYWSDPKSKPAIPLAENSQLLLRMPNWQNVGDELFRQGGFPDLLSTGKPAGLWLGSLTQVGLDLKNKPIFKYVYRHRRFALCGI